MYPVGYVSFKVKGTWCKGLKGYEKNEVSKGPHKYINTSLFCVCVWR